MRIKKTSSFVLLILMIVTLMLVGCSPRSKDAKKYEDFFYCDLMFTMTGGYETMGGTWDSWTTPVQKSSKITAGYRAVKVYEEEGVSIQYEIRDRYTNDLCMLIEYDWDGKVLSVRETTQKSELRNFKTLYEYNEDGTLAQTTDIRIDTGEEVLFVTFEYNSNKKCARQLRHVYERGGSETYVCAEFIYEYSAEGKKVQITKRGYYDSKDHSKVTDEEFDLLEYNEAGQIINRMLLDREGNPVPKYTFVYADSILQKIIYSNGMYNDYRYDIFAFMYSRWREVRLPLPELDERERLSKLIVYDHYYLGPIEAPEAILFEFTYKYDSDDNRVRESIVRDGETILYITYEYGENDVCTKSTVYDGAGKVIKENNGYTNIFGRDPRYDSEISSEYDFALCVSSEVDDWMIQYGVKDKNLAVIE